MKTLIKQESKKSLIEKALEIYNTLRRCTETSSASVCRKCPYFKKRFENNGCCNTLMTDAAKTIKSLVEEVDTWQT